MHLSPVLGNREATLHGNYPQTQLWMVSVCWLMRWDFPRLLGSYWRCYWNDRPGASLLLDDHNYSLAPEVAVLIPPGSQARPSLTSPCWHLHVHFTPGLQAGADVPLAAVPLARPEIERFRSLATNLREGRDVTAHFLAQSLVNEMLARLPGKTWQAEPVDTRIREALTAIRTAFPRAVDNAALAAQAGMHVNAFIRRFTRVTGVSPHQHLLDLRVEMASRLLHHTDQSIEAIAAQCGFTNRYHFTRVFRSRMTMGPGAFRRLAER